MKDIETYEDVLDLIKLFYKKLLFDEQIGHFFQELNLDLTFPESLIFGHLYLLINQGILAT